MSHRPTDTSPSAFTGRSGRRRAVGVTTAGLAAAAMTLSFVQLPAANGAPGAAPGPTPPEFHGLGETPHGAEEIDVRGSVLPTVDQLRAARSLDATIRWNDFGTPASLLPRSGSLGAASSSDAAVAARDWLRNNRTLLGLSSAEVGGLELVNSQELAQSKARAVLFRQKFGGLVPAVGGMVTVGVADGRIAYVSSSLVKNASAPADAVLSPAEGWAAAANSVEDFLGLEGELSVSGLVDGLEIVDAAKADATEDTTGDWTRLTHPDFAQEQQARVRALAMADGIVKPVIEANVVNVTGGHAAAYTVLVDASDGSVVDDDILFRTHQVEQFADTVTGPSTAMPVAEDNPAKLPFQGELVADCDAATAHEFTIDDDTRQIVAAATAANPANDIVVKVYGPEGQLLSEGDTGTSPEAVTYSGDPVPPGDYSVRVCMYDGAAPLPPANYVGNVSVSSAATPEAGLPFPPKWRYFPTNPTPRFGADHTPTNSVVGCWVTGYNRQKVPGCTEPNGPLRNTASRAPWDVNPSSELPTFTTLGNNASDREAWVSPLTPGGFFQAPFSPSREYLAEFSDQWNNSRCDPTNFHPGGNDILFSVQNLFVSHNRMHDYSYYLGFTEKNYNMQQNNFGAGGLGNDPEIGNVQAGAADTQVFDQTGVATGRNNANQITLQDGTPGITNQYLFQPVAGAFYAPCTDGGLDMGIVGHEYTHAISNRMIGGPDEGITSDQGGAMGESWGDLVGAEYQFSNGYGNGGNVWAVGLYATGNLKTAIRNYAIDDNPLTYGELGYDSTGNQVHADGEIWSGTMWRVRQALVDKYDERFPYDDENLQVRCADGLPNVGPNQAPFCPGNRRWVQLMFDSFLLQQGATSMLDARDAFIAADQLRFNGANKAVIWKAFARSGMGVGARTANADAGDVDPSFRAPAGNTDVRFVPRLPNGKRVPGKVYLGTYEARATPVADTLGDTGLDDKVAMTPGTYPGVFQSAKTGLTRFTLKVSGTSIVKRIPVSTNLASLHNGAEVVSATEGSRNADSLIDNTEATNWGGVTEGNVDETKPSVTVDLAGGTHTVRKVVVSALLRPADDSDPDSGSRFTALRKFAVEVCASRCGSVAGWKRVFTSADDAFPATQPRPTSPKLNFRSFAFPAVEAQQVRLVVLENQCTGYRGYAGEQDNDELNVTDCKAGSDRGTIVHAAEFEVFGR